MGIPLIGVARGREQVEKEWIFHESSAPAPRYVLVRILLAILVPDKLVFWVVICYCFPSTIGIKKCGYKLIWPSNLPSLYQSGTLISTEGNPGKARMSQGLCAA